MHDDHAAPGPHETLGHEALHQPGDHLSGRAQVLRELLLCHSQRPVRRGVQRRGWRTQNVVNQTRLALRALRACTVALGTAASAGAQGTRSGNPVLPGWYGDPEAHVFDGRYWIYPTYSAPYDQQTLMDAFSSARRHRRRARAPDGPFKDVLGKPLIDKFHNGAQPIDQNVFKDRDGSYYIVYGGRRHCNIAKPNADFTGLVPFADGTTFKEITPAGYVEGAFMLLEDNKYYFMWSEGGWTGPNYAVAYAIGSSPCGPFERVGKILQQDSTVATGAGHHSVLHSPASDKWYIVISPPPTRRHGSESSCREHRRIAVRRSRFHPTRGDHEDRRRCRSVAPLMMIAPTVYEAVGASRSFHECRSRRRPCARDHCRATRRV